MSFVDKKITGYKDSVSSLSDYPSDDGVTAAQLKAIFDSRTDNEVKEKFNALIDALSESTAASELGAEGGTVQEMLDSKVEKEEGMGLSQVSYTYENREKLSRVEDGAQVNTVLSVAGKTGHVSLSKSDVGLSNVDNTRDLDKPISDPQRAELEKKATKINPEFTGAINIDDILIYKSDSDEGEVIIFRPMSKTFVPESTIKIGYDFIKINGHAVYHDGNHSDITTPGNVLDEATRGAFMTNTGLDVVLGDIEAALDNIIAMQSELIGGETE